MRGPVPWLAAPLLLHSTLRPRVGAPPFCQAPPPPKPRLMLVEDQDGLRSAVCKYLQQRGYVVEAFSRVDAAFDAITKGLFPDLIVTDVTMPGLDGYQLLKRVRADPRLCGVPVILLTARGLSDDRIAGYSAGASSYVSKPFEPEELLAVVNAQLTNARLAHDATLTNELQARARLGANPNPDPNPNANPHPHPNANPHPHPNLLAVVVHSFALLVEAFRFGLG